jgi:acyl-CoA reductase-like NAD-dependent aldehyde dehydrogenase
MTQVIAKFVKGKKETACDPALAAALEAVFGDSNADKDKAANVLAQVWPQIAKEAGEFEKIVIEAEGTKYIKGEAVEFPVTIEVLNLNLQAVLAGVVKVNEVMEAARRQVEAQKALYKQSRSITYHGYEAGKRGRKSGNQFAGLLSKYG